ncbi:hypothetical protein AKO1_010967 [Acrasis kona]|uniref:AAA+ ATPase domain-containing protein n=1 Tax=Acrasis kona TaxID=1008807 RepID=A0AAW2YSR2_9EUKA
MAHFDRKVLCVIAELVLRVGMKTFHSRDPVKPENSFYVDPNEWNQQYLQPIIDQGKHAILLGPSQSGKTSRALLYQSVLKCNGYLCLYISAMNMALPPSDLFNRFKLEMKDQLLQFGQKYQIDFNSFAGFFDSKFNKPMVLIIDEIDALGAAHVNAEQRREFLSVIKSQKDRRIAGGIVTLVATIAISNVFVINDTIGSSAYIMDVVYAPFFSLDQTRTLFSQYETQNGISVDPKIVEQIYEFTNGAPGLTAIMGQQLDNEKKRLKRVPNPSEWHTFLNSKTCIRNVLQTANYSLMYNHLLRDKHVFNILLDHLSNKRPLGAIQKDDLDFLQKINVIRVVKNNVTVANPFVLCLIAYMMRKEPSNRQNPTLLSPNGNVDVKNLILEAAKLINPFDVLLQEKQASNNHCSNCPPGYKEITYVNAFKKAMEELMQAYQHSKIY